MATTDLVPFAVDPAILAALRELIPESNDDLTDGVAPSFAIVTFRGKVWRVRYKGDDKVIMTRDGDPVASIVTVMVKSSPAISKLYYKTNYTEGDDTPPACFSLDGVRPDASAAEQQSPTCASCKHNVWGSKVLDNGTKTKACADNRRLAVVPYPDIANAHFGGPMLLRVPPASLQELARFGDSLKQAMLPYQAVVVKIGFDHEAAYPKLTFAAVRPLTVDEATKILEMKESDQVGRMLMEPIAGDENNPTGAPAPAAPAEPVEAPVEEPKPEPAPKPKPAPKPAPAPAPEPAPEPVAAAAPTPVDTAEIGTSFFGGPEPVQKAATTKTSPAKQAAAPAEQVSDELAAMVTNLLQ